MRLEKAQGAGKAQIICIFGLLSRFVVMFLATAMSLMPPATVLAQQSAQIGERATMAVKASATEDNSIRSFRVNIPQEAIDDLRQRIAATRWPDRETVTDSSQGVRLATMQKLARYWGTDYDWRKCEAKLKALPHFMTEIDGLDIHFIHVRSEHEDALPLIVTHGWPGSIIEQLKIVDPLVNPTARARRTLSIW